MKTSPARRIYQALKQAQEYQNPSGSQIQTIRLWAAVFSIDTQPFEANLLNLEDPVVARLKDLREELAELQRAVVDPEIREALTPLADATRNLTAVQLFYQDWTQTKANLLRPEFIGGWKWASITLPSEDDDVTDEAIAALRGELEQLELAANEPGVPEALRRLVQKQAALIRDALGRYPIRGVGPLRDAISQATGELLREQDEIKSAVAAAPEAGATVFERVKSTFNAVAALCDKADKIKRGYLLAMAIYDKALPMIEHVKHLGGG